MKAKVKALRVDCITGKSSYVSCELEDYDHEMLGKCVHLHGGPTGYEGFVLKDSRSLDHRFRGGWWACMGTHGKWDSLFVEKEDLLKGLKELGITPS
nr:hypothetical protein 18 [Candidatus Omnitrophota bacterium]